MKKALSATVYGWAVGVLVIWSAALVMANVFRWTIRGWELIKQLLDVAVDEIWFAICVAVVAFPICLLTAAILAKLPRSSPLWKPPIAAAIGAVAGPIVMYLLAAAIAREFFVPEFHEIWEKALFVAPCLVGCVFALSYSLMKKSRPETP